MGRLRACGAWLPLLAVVLVLTACGTPTLPGSPGPSGSPEPTRHTASEGASRPPSVPEEVWDAVLADLGTQRGEPAAAVTVVTAEAVTFSDGSLGCPEPGMVYTQALVDGYQVVLEVEGKQYDYRIGAGTDVRLCTSET